jgi:glucose-6-phosphate isomerase
MDYSREQLWQRFQKYYFEYPALGLALDLSRMNFADDFMRDLQPRLDAALAAMSELEQGGIANPDEKRMVGHYWLRNPGLAPKPEIAREIEDTIVRIRNFAADVHTGKLAGKGGPFNNLLVIGIGGSALGPQFVASALGQPGADKLKACFLDNTDPDGIDKTLSTISHDLRRTLAIVISKSGGTKETRNGMLEATQAYQRAGLVFGQHAVAITSQGSELDKFSKANRWIGQFPMWDWVGGRTSELSAVGLLPAALQGFDIDNMLSGAKACDEVTRSIDALRNPAALMAAMWFYSGNGAGAKNMVVLPYKDRLELFSKYLQQLIMESLGKEIDLTGRRVNQGLTVLGNKGSTDQHSYIQQLRDGLSNFFVTFIEVLRDRNGDSIQIEPNVTTGDYLNGFFQGTRHALHENGRESITLTLSQVSPFAVGVLIALFERTVGIYANLIKINAYHQPGVEAGKRAASAVIDLQLRILEILRKTNGKGCSVLQIANDAGGQDEAETIFKICEHLAANPDRKVIKTPGRSPFEALYSVRQ